MNLWEELAAFGHADITLSYVAWLRAGKAPPPSRVEVRIMLKAEATTDAAEMRRGFLRSFEACWAKLVELGYRLEDHPRFETSGHMSFDGKVSGLTAQGTYYAWCPADAQLQG